MSPNRSSRQSDTRSHQATRAQTLNDFAIGISIFFFTILFVFAFIPNILAPFNISGAAGLSIQADRSAAHLSNSVLGADNTTQVLNGSCTQAFFANTSSSTCGSYTPASLQTTLGTSQTLSVNISMVALGTDTVVSYRGTTLTRGERLPVSQRTSTATRLVQLDGTTYRLHVRVW